MSEVGADGAALKGLYLEGAAFKAQIIEALASAGIPVHSVKHTGDFHVVQIPTPPRLKNPELFAQWRKQHPVDGVPEASAAAAPPAAQE